MSETQNEYSVGFIREQDLTDDMIRLYFQLLSPKRQGELTYLASPGERRIALCREIAARRVLADLNGLPEDRVEFSVSADGKYVVPSGKGFLSVIVVGGSICAAATAYRAGLGAAPVVPFRFSEAQQVLSDAEVRSVVAASGYSLMDMVNAGKCGNPAAAEMYAKFSALKDAANACLKPKQRLSPSKISFTCADSRFTCRDAAFETVFCGTDKKAGLAAAIIRKKEGSD